TILNRQHSTDRWHRQRPVQLLTRVLFRVSVTLVEISSVKHTELSTAYWGTTRPNRSRTSVSTLRWEIVHTIKPYLRWAISNRPAEITSVQCTLLSVRVAWV